MKKELSEMSLEELWHLFPIQLTEHQPNWHEWYEEEAYYLYQILSSTAEIKIYHIGSTAIQSIWAKPIIDILIEVNDEKAFESVEKILICAGCWICVYV